MLNVTDNNFHGNGTGAEVTTVLWVLCANGTDSCGIGIRTGKTASGTGLDR